MRHTNSRARVALVLIFVLLVCLRFESANWVIGIFALVIAFAGTNELLKMGDQKHTHPSRLLAVGGALAYVLAGFFPPSVFITSAVVITLLMMVFAFIIQMTTSGIEDSYRQIPQSMFGPIYIGLPLAAGLQILWIDRIMFLYVLLLVWTLDSAAYYVGRRYGKNKLAPRLSPGKTREGAAGGIAGCFVVAIIIKLLVPESAFVLGWVDVLVTALLVAIAGQLGDLAESALKRDAGVKDSGPALTGHGGVLDRIDSLLFVFPVFFVYLLVNGMIVPFEAAVLQL